ncbi:MAG: hypothetical protein ACR2QK_14020 [Acidimicrobiales bacterium]
MSSDDPWGRAEAFVTAIVWGEHTTIWRLLSPAGRTAALSVAVGNGLDRVVAARIDGEVADPTEFEDFLRQLVGGLRRDLRSVEAAKVTTAAATADDGDGDGGATVDEAIVELATPSDIPGTGDWPAGRVHLSRDDERGWLIDRLEPRLAGP